MEQYALLIIFGAMVGLWWFAWQPWKKRPGPETEQDPPGRDETPR